MVTVYIIKICGLILASFLAILLSVPGDDVGANWFESKFGKKPLDYLGINKKYHIYIWAFAFILAVFFLVGDVRQFFFDKSQTSEPSSTYCSLEVVSRKAAEGDFDELQRIARVCQSVDQAVAENAKVALKNVKETSIHQGALTCFNESLSKSSCNVDSLNTCLAVYVSSSPLRSHFEELKSRIQEERKSARCNPPVTSICSQQDDFDKAMNEGIEGLRKFIGKCQSKGGTFVEKARTELKSAEESSGYQKALSCFISSSSETVCSIDSLNACLSAYQATFPSGAHAGELRQKAEQESKSARCNPPPLPSICRQQDDFDKAVNAGIEGLRKFISKCQPEGGTLVEKAKTELKIAEEKAKTSPKIAEETKPAESTPQLPQCNPDAHPVLNHALGRRLGIPGCGVHYAMWVGGWKCHGAFAATPDGRCAWSNGQLTLQIAREKVMQYCKKNNMKCTIFVEM